MKVLVESKEEDGLIAFLGKKITIFLDRIKGAKHD
jgi:hypothetical protein